MAPVRVPPASLVDQKVGHHGKGEWDRLNPSHEINARKSRHVHHRMTHQPSVIRMMATVVAAKVKSDS